MHGRKKSRTDIHYTTVLHQESGFQNELQVSSHLRSLFGGNPLEGTFVPLTIQGGHLGLRITAAGEKVGRDFDESYLRGAETQGHISAVDRKKSPPRGEGGPNKNRLQQHICVYKRRRNMRWLDGTAAERCSDVVYGCSLSGFVVRHGWTRRRTRFGASLLLASYHSNTHGCPSLCLDISSQSGLCEPPNILFTRAPDHRNIHSPERATVVERFLLIGH